MVETKLGREARNYRNYRNYVDAPVFTNLISTGCTFDPRLQSGKGGRVTVIKWLKAGVLEDGTVTVSDRGTGQGSAISPLLANIYLHYVYDLWAERWRRDYGDGITVTRPPLPFLCAMRYCPMIRLNRVVTPRKQGRTPKGDVAGAETNE